MTAAYNMLALRIPWHQIPVFQTKQYDKKLQLTGFAKNYNSIHVIGDVKNWDFLAFYSYDE